MRARVLLCLTLIAFVATAAVANAYVVRNKNGRLVGILPTPQAIRDHLVPTSSPQIPLVYNGGSVMLSSKIYEIFWGPSGSFAASYENPIVQWAQDLAANSGRTTNEFSVGSEYYQNLTGTKQYITRNVSFGGAVADTRPFPASACTNPSNPNGVCLIDGQIQNEILNVINTEGWPVDNPTAPVAEYLLFTPRNVDSCMDATATDCTYTASGFCAYHSSIGLSGGSAVVYSNLPYQPGCDSGQAPGGVDGNADTDGTLDSAIHEIEESATDPGADGNLAWLDNNGNEIGDKCTSPVTSTIQAGYGTPLGGSLAATTAFNQLINGHTYYTQQLYSNAATKTPSSTVAAACVQRIGPTPQFLAPTATQHVGQPVSFNGASSYDIVDPITKYAWNYGDGSAVDTSHGAHGVHTYTKAGTYKVTLTVSDAFGAIDATTETQTVKVVSP